MKRTNQLASGNVPNVSSGNKSGFKGFRKPWKRTGPIIDFRHFSDLPKEEQEITFRGLKTGHRFWH